MSLRDPKTQRFLLTVVVAGVALWAYGMTDLLPFGYRVRTRQARELRAAQETVAAELEKARRTVGNLPQLEREQQELERKWKQAQALLPTEKEMPELLTQITQAGEQAGVGFQMFKPGATKPQEFYSENPVAIQVKGGYHQVGVFLSRLANLPRIVNVGDLQLAGSAQKGRAKGERKAASEERTDHTLVASFTATAYSLRDPATVTPSAPHAEKGGRRDLKSAGIAPPKLGVTGAARRVAGGKQEKLPVEGEQ
jgi:type IV pilus assembly protein PilO